MRPKVLFVISLCVIYLSTTALSNGDLEAGHTYGTKLIHNGTYEKTGKELKKRSKEIEVKAPHNQRIQAIVVKDWLGDGASHIRAGGVGKRKVSLKLKSPKSRGFKFSVSVYAF
ncbi:unnamed protein product, partial [Iphiclides podalirius]